MFLFASFISGKTHLQNSCGIFGITELISFFTVFIYRVKLPPLTVEFPWAHSTCSRLYNFSTNRSSVSKKRFEWGYDAIYLSDESNSLLQMLKNRPRIVSSIENTLPCSTANPYSTFLVQENLQIFFRMVKKRSPSKVLLFEQIFFYFIELCFEPSVVVE